MAFWDDNAIDTPGSPVSGGDFASQLTALYAKYGRGAPSPEEIAAHQGNPGGLAAVEAQLAKDNAAGGLAGPAAAAGKPSAQDFIQQWQQSHPSSEGIGPLADALQQAGYGNVSRFMYGATPSNNELSIDGQKFKVLGGENSSSPYWYTGGDDSAPNQYGFGAPPNAYASNPNAPVYTPPATPSWLSSPYTPERYTANTFVKPTVEEVMAEPDYQFGLEQGTKQIQRSAAARGTVLNPGTVQALNRYGTDYATTKYGDVLARDIGIFGMNEGNRFGAFQANSGNALAARQQNQGEYQQNVLAPAQQTFQNQYASYLNDNARTLQDYLTSYNVQHTADTDYWNRLKDVSGMGLTAAINGRAS